MYRILRNKIPPQNVLKCLKCRWILTWKDADQNTHLGANYSGNPNRKAKARLVILGYQDPETQDLERDSSTLWKLSRNLCVQLCVSNKWTIGSFDIKIVFLRIPSWTNRFEDIRIGTPRRIKNQARPETHRDLSIAQGSIWPRQCPVVMVPGAIQGPLWIRILTSTVRPMLFHVVWRRSFSPWFCGNLCR